MQQVQAIEKNDMVVRDSVVVLILKDHNRVIRLLPRQRMRPGGRVAHPQTTARIKLKRHRVCDGKAHLGCIQIDPITLSYLHHFPLH